LMSHQIWRPYRVLQDRPQDRHQSHQSQHQQQHHFLDLGLTIA
jgi:hypothetical protein